MSKNEKLVQDIDFCCFRCSDMKQPLDKCIYFATRTPNFCRGFNIREEKSPAEGYDDVNIILEPDDTFRTYEDMEMMIYPLHFSLRRIIYKLSKQTEKIPKKHIIQKICLRHSISNLMKIAEEMENWLQEIYEVLGH